MFTPEKTSLGNGLLAFCSNSFQNSLRRYDSSGKNKPSHNPDLSHKYYLMPFPCQSRLSRYTRVREEEMAKSRSRVKILMGKDCPSKKVQLSPSKRFDQSLLRVNIPPPQLQSKNPIHPTIEIEGHVRHQNDMKPQKIEGQVQNTSMYQTVIFETVEVINSFEVGIEETMEDTYQQHQCRMQIESQSETCHQSSVAYQAEECGGFLVVSSREARYRISLRQLDIISKKFLDLDSLVDYLAHHRPYLAPMKGHIASALGRFKSQRELSSCDEYLCI